MSIPIFFMIIGGESDWEEERGRGREEGFCANANVLGAYS